MNKDKIAVINEALLAPFCSLCWMDEGIFHEAHVNISKGINPGTGFNTFTLNNAFVQVECEGVPLNAYGSYFDQVGHKPNIVWSKKRVGDCTNAKLVLRDDKIFITRNSQTGEKVAEILLCSVDAVLGVSILQEYGAQHSNYDLRSLR